MAPADSALNVSGLDGERVLTAALFPGREPSSQPLIENFRWLEQIPTGQIDGVFHEDRRVALAELERRLSTRTG